MKKNIFIIPFLILFINCNYTKETSSFKEQLMEITNSQGEKIHTSLLEKNIQKKIDSLEIAGMAIGIINHGELVYTNYFGYKNRELEIPIDHQTVFETASISKSVFAYFVVQLAEEGIINLDTPLYEYLPLQELDDERKKQITARMVLSHTSGLPNWRFLNKEGELNLAFDPGTHFNYSGEGYEYLASVIAHRFDTDMKGLENVLKEKLYTPLGFKNAGFILSEDMKQQKPLGYSGKEIGEKLPEELPYFGAAFGFHATIKDFSKFLTAILNKEILTQEMYAEMFKKQVTLPEDESLRTENGFDSWGLGFMRAETSDGLKIAHGGMNPSFQGYYMMIPEKQFGYVFFTNSDTGIQLLPFLENVLESR